VANPPDVDALVREIESLVEEAGDDPRSRRIAEQLVRLLMQLYGAALERVVEILRGANALTGLTEDKLLASLLLLHGMHPESAETRVREALHRVQRRLDGHYVDLQEIADGVARVRVDRNGGGYGRRARIGWRDD